MGKDMDAFAVIISVTLIHSQGVEKSFSCFLTPSSLKFLSLPILGLGKMWERNSWFPGETTNFQKEAFPASPRSSRRAPRGADVLQGKPLDWAFNCHLPVLLGFPGGSDVKESACNARDQGSIPASGRSPGEANGYPLQYSCLDNSMDRAWQAMIHGVAKSQAQLSD